jgi:hypothetical protein
MTGIVQYMTTSFKTEILSVQHNFSTATRTVTGQDVFKIALYSVAGGASLDATTTVYTTTGEITGTGYAAGGNTLTISQTPTSAGTPSTTAYINFADTMWSGASFSADGALIYNSTNGNKSVAVLNFGATKTVSVGTFTITFPPAGTGSAIVQIQ